MSGPHCRFMSPMSTSRECSQRNILAPKLPARSVKHVLWSISDYTTKLLANTGRNLNPAPGTASSPGAPLRLQPAMPSQPQLSRNSARKIVAWLLLIALGGIFFHFYRQYQPAENKIAPESWRAAPKIEDYAIFLQAPDLNDPLALVRYKTVSMLGADFLNNMPTRFRRSRVLFDSQVWMEAWSSRLKIPSRLWSFNCSSAVTMNGWF